MNFLESVSEDCFLFPTSLAGTQAKDEESQRKRFPITTYTRKCNFFTTASSDTPQIPLYLGIDPRTPSFGPGQKL